MAAASADSAHATFFDRLSARCTVLNSILCVGLDPHGSDLEAQTAAAALAFCRRVIDATSSVAVAYKPNAAFFEAFGAEGWAALKTVIAEIQAKGSIALLDCKRGDIGSTSTAYATACFEELGADAVTLHGYMGSDSIQPFCGDNAARGAFVLCKTSNPSSVEVQSLALAPGSGPTGAGTVFEAVAAASADWGKGGSNVGLVVGATDLDALKRVRAIRPDVWILAPGVGAQGASASEVAAAGIRADGLGLLVPVSRGISRAADMHSAAKELNAALNAAREAATAGLGDKSSGTAAEASALPLQPHQLDFLQCALSEGVLRFGDFTLKSGRSSPYFFNAGLFTMGGAIARVGRAYARTVVDSGLEFDVVFGPAYKGIPLATAVGMSLAALGRDCPVAYNRKETKDHGEGGLLVGTPVRGKRVLLVDDVMSSGKAVMEAADILAAAGATLAGVVVGLDRQERRSAEDARAATAAVSESLEVPVFCVACLDDLIRLMSGSSADKTLAGHVEAMRTYRAEWGI